MLSMQSTFDQFYVSANNESIRSAHEGLLDKRLVFGALSFGYLGELIPGELTSRKRPRSRIVIDPEAADLVRQIYRWYVEERMQTIQIMRRLNAMSEPMLPPNCKSGRWTRGAVERVLKNRRYRGCWEYGVTESVYLPEQDYVTKHFRAEPLRAAQIEELRIVTDELWHAVQVRRLDGGHGGRNANDGDSVKRPVLLNGIFVCPAHQEKQRLWVGGNRGQYMVCPVCQGIESKSRPLFSMLNRELAAQLTCHKCAELLMASDETLIGEVVSACQAEVQESQLPDPGQVARLKSELQGLSASIAAALRNPGVTEADQAETDSLVRDFRSQRAKVAAKLGFLGSALTRAIRVPTVDEVREMLTNLEQILLDGATRDPERVNLVRSTVELLTGGEIELFQAGEARSHGGWLQGRFKLHLLNCLVKKVTGVSALLEHPAVEVIIDYREAPRAKPSLYAPRRFTTKIS